MRNNLDRLGGPHTPQSDNPQTDNGLSFVIPTEHIELPSKGRCYPEGHVLHNQETVEIRFMTAKDEDTLTSKSLIKKGVVIDKLISDLLINKQIRADSLLIGDRNAIIVAARISGYGSDYDTKVTCPSCNKTQEYSFDLSSPNVNHSLAEEDLAGYEVVKDELGIHHLILPMSKIKLSFRLLNGRDEKVIVDKASTKTQVQNETNSTDLLRMTIVAVNDIQDRNTIEQFIQTMPARDSIYLKKLLKIVTPNISFNNTFECRFCGFDTEMEVPFTADFFWVNR
jgi:hypothetical protein